MSNAWNNRVNRCLRGFLALVFLGFSSFSFSATTNPIPFYFGSAGGSDSAAGACALAGRVVGMSGSYYGCGYMIGAEWNSTEWLTVRDGCPPNGSAPLAGNVCAPLQCPPGYATNFQGQCVMPACPAGQIRDAQFNCIPKPPKVCGSNEVLINDVCIPKPPDECRPPYYPKPDGTCGRDPEKGDKGDNGDKGDKGEKGDKGDNGDKGDKGEKGDKGDKGDKGENGSSGANGAAGSNGANGANGSNGATGATGAAGAQGAQGIQGLRGLTGSNGTNGANGATGAAGGNGTNGKDGENGKSFCEEHPELTICKESSTQGQCDAVSCAGDAIQCAQLQQTAMLQCKQKQIDDEYKEMVKKMGETGEYNLGKSLMDGQDPLDSQLPNIKNASQIDVGKSINMSGSGGSCFADRSIFVLGREVLIPLGKVCSYLEFLKYVVILLASLTCFRMLSGAVLRD